ANQGSLIIALDIAAFMSPDAFKRQMDAYMEQTGRMQPMPGYDRATLPGVLEAEREQTWRQEGIPVDSGHRAALAKAASQFGISMPF
ncbi:MAG: Ldh family oxidoreductase, partial [Eubacteriales bacterium]|nr:Ldh family oxidoreductase [Eubacteriales bacterium]